MQVQTYVTASNIMERQSTRHANRKSFWNCGTLYGTAFFSCAVFLMLWRLQPIYRNWSIPNQGIRGVLVSSVRVLPGRNLLVGAKSPILKIRTLFWLRIWKMLLCRPKTKSVLTLTEFAMFKKSIAYKWISSPFWPLKLVELHFTKAEASRTGREEEQHYGKVRALTIAASDRRQRRREENQECTASCTERNGMTK